ncbi:Polysaccharide biosynthesis protein [Capnocytophaga canis]|uniref:oligosaccharide flippase family protein n=1 Tax=Capnocytophaga canis TaxID=1848903 RepID=UPI000589ACA9|nr:oligosaccharide flippase family protein [Capnocytophaga canis]CEN43375.1 Polysaccharide biosynthesis protein [Capnocytophaga canis]
MNQLKKGAILSYLNIILTNVVGLVLTPFIIRSLGDSEYGLYTLIGAFVGYLSIMDLGLNNTIVRYVAKYRAENNKKKEEDFLGTSLMMYGGISLIVMIFGLSLYSNIENIFGETLNPEQISKAKLMMLLLVFNLMVSIPGGSFAAICNAYEHFVFPRAMNVIKYVLRSVLVITVLYQGADSVGLVLLDTILNVFFILISYFYVKNNLKIIFRFHKMNKRFIFEIFSYSMWIFLFAVTEQILWKGGQFIIGTKSDPSQVGIYAIGIVLGSYYAAFSGAISNLFLPKAIQMIVKKTSSIELTFQMTKIARFSLFSLMLIFIEFLLLGRQFVSLWVGKNYIESYYIAVIVMIGYTTPLIQKFANSILEAKNLFKYNALIYLGCIVLGMLSSLFLVEKFGVIGVISGIATGWIIAQIIMNVFFVKKLGLDIILFFKLTAKGLVFVFVLTLVVSFLITQIVLFKVGWLDFMIKAVLIGIVYICSLYTIGMNTQEKGMIVSLIKHYLKP